MGDLIEYNGVKITLPDAPFPCTLAPHDCEENGCSDPGGLIFNNAQLDIIYVSLFARLKILRKTFQGRLPDHQWEAIEREKARIEEMLAMLDQQRDDRYKGRYHEVWLK